MYEQLTYEQIKARMLGVVHELETAEGLVFDKREGSIVDVALSPFALESKNMFIAIDWLLRQVFADTADRKYLIMRAAERGVSPREASFAVRVAYVTFSDSPTAQTAAGYLAGARFNRGTLNYAFKEVKSIEDGVAVCTVTCETAGSVGNVDFGDLTPLSSIQNFTSAELIAAEDLTDDEEEYVIPGEDEESTEDFRKRYFRSFDVAFGGNVADYRNHIDDIDGVGGVRIRRAWPDGGYVEAYVQNVIAEGGGAASADTVALVQETIDPFGVASPVIVDDVEWGQGTGLGLAPIGHRVRIYSVTEAPIHITGTIDIGDGADADWGVVKEAIKARLEEYYAGKRNAWEGDAIFYENNDANQTMISWGEIFTIINGTPGVEHVDPTNLLVTTPSAADTPDVGEDLILEQSEVPVLGRLNEFVVSGTVTDVAGNPVEGVTVTTSTAGEPVRTGADGTYSILVDGGSQTISASKTGYLPYADTVEITEDTLIDITLAQAVKVGGIVLDPNGDPIEGVHVVFDDGENTYTDDTDSDGKYNVGVPTSGGEYDVSFGKDGYNTQTVTVTVMGEVTLPNITLTPTVTTKTFPFRGVKEYGTGGTYIENASITVMCGGDSMTGTTDAAGNCDFDIPIGWNDISYSISATGYTTHTSEGLVYSEISFPLSPQLRYTFPLVIALQNQRAAGPAPQVGEVTITANWDASITYTGTSSDLRYGVNMGNVLSGYYRIEASATGFNPRIITSEGLIPVNKVTGITYVVKLTEAS